MSYFTVSKTVKGEMNLIGLPQIPADQISAYYWTVHNTSTIDAIRNSPELYYTNLVLHKPLLRFKLNKGIYFVDFFVDDIHGNTGRYTSIVKVP